MTLWRKRYAKSATMATAVRNYRLLEMVGMNMPQLITADYEIGELAFEWIDGSHPTDDAQIIDVARELGAAHGRAEEALRRWQGTPWPQVPDFWHRRAQILRERIAQSEQKLVSSREVSAFIRLSAATPRTLYKDCNVRNVLMTEDAAWFVDFDDLTVAPPGYDLAKLLVSAGMTSGRRPPIAESAGEYFDALYRAGNCGYDAGSVQLWCAMHGVLTDPYFGRNGYIARWESVISATDRAELRAGIDALV